MAKQTATRSNGTVSKGLPPSSLDELFESVDGEEVIAQSAPRLKIGEHVMGLLEGREVRSSVDQKTGEVKPYEVYLVRLDDGAMRAVGGAPVLEGLMKAINIGDKFLAARAADGLTANKRTKGIYRVKKLS